ncbi:MAG: TonB-dependent receptor plug domain-containing protein [bacterium]
MSKTSFTGRLLQSTILAGALSAAAAGAAIAQDDEFVITGSRIKGTELDSFQPVTVISEQDIDITGKVNIGEVLLELPGQGSGLSRTYNNGGDGSVRIDFRNLGSARTLVLVNGRRWINSGEGANSSVDLSTIPGAAVESVEILKDGASAVYGSDAIAAVVNVKLKDDFEGAQFSAQTGSYFDEGGTQTTYEALIGAKSDRGSIMVGASFVDQGFLSNADRAETAARPAGGGSSGTPQGRFAYGGVVTDNGMPCSNFTVREGTGGQALGASDAGFRCWTSPDDRFNYNPYNYVETPSERTNIFAVGKYEFIDGINTRLELTYQNRESNQLLAPTPLFWGFGSFLDNVGNGISAQNIYNPFGLNFCGFTTAELSTGLNSDGDACDTYGWFGRRMLEVGNRNFSQDQNTFRAGLFFDGSIGDTGWDWEAYYIQGDNSNSTRTDGLLNVGNVEHALSAACNTDASCVPLNIFGGQGTDSVYLGDGLWGGSGSITQAMIDYITFTGTDTGGNSINNYGADFTTSSLFSMPAGDVGFAVGFEHRNESGFFQPDAFIAAGLSSGNAASPVSGEFDVDEVYAEFKFPILENLDVDYAVRFSDYSTFGDTTNNKIGAKWQALPSLAVRGTWSEGFRAPSISNLFGGTGDSFPDVDDPCDVNSPNFIGNPDGTQVGQCLAEGVPTNFTQPNGQIRTTVGSNPNLTPEESESYTFGLIFQPEQMEGLQVFVDYYNIEVTNLISTIGAQNIVNGCYVGTNPEYCALVTRGPTGLFTEVTNTLQNVGNLETAGIELSAIYDMSNSMGDWRFNADMRWMDKYDVTLANGNVESNAGYVIGTSRDHFGEFRGNFGAIWMNGPWNAGATVQVIGAADGVAGQVPAVTASGAVINPDPITELDTTAYLDVQVGYDFEAYPLSVTVGVDNVLDQDPPLFTDTFANDFDPAYRTWGSQAWYVRATSEF